MYCAKMPKIYVIRDFQENQSRKSKRKRVRETHGERERERERSGKSEVIFTRL